MIKLHLKKQLNPSATAEYLECHSNFRKLSEFSEVYVEGTAFRSCQNSHARNDNSILSEEKRIISCIWGNYTAVYCSSDKGCVSIVPEPTGNKDVYFHSDCSGVYVSDSLNWIISKVSGGAKPRLSSIIDKFHNLSRYGQGTILNGVSRIPLGHVLRCDTDGRALLYRIWPIRYGNSLKTFSTVEHEVEELIEYVLKSISDNNTAVFLSGGRDSSLLSALFAKLQDEKDEKSNYIYISSKNKGDSEEKYAKYVAERHGAQLISLTDNEYFAGTEDQWVDFSYPENHADARVLKLVSERIDTSNFVDGKIGDSVFLNEIFSGYLSGVPMRDVLGMELPNKSFPNLLISKNYARFFTAKYLQNRTRARFRSLESALTEKAIDLLPEAHNTIQFSRDVSRLAKVTSASKATYVTSVLTEMLLEKQNFRNLPVFYPFGSQPLLDYLFTVDLRSFMGKESRSLQRSMLSRLGLPMIAARQHKSGMQMSAINLLVKNRNSVFSLIESGVFNTAGMIDLKQVEKYLKELEAGISNEGISVILNLLELESAYRRINHK